MLVERPIYRYRYTVATSLREAIAVRAKTSVAAGWSRRQDAGCPAAGHPPAGSPARERILASADRLFYGQGIRAVAVHQLIADAQVTLTTFYRHFPSKDQLLAAYLTARGQRAREQLDRIRRESPGDPRAILQGIAVAQIEDGRAPGFRGCEFINAAAEFGELGHAARELAREQRAWIRQTMADLLRDHGHPRPSVTAEQLQMLRTGLTFAQGIDGSPAAEDAFLAAWDRLIDIRR